jgi:hypothetical protein
MKKFLPVRMQEISGNGAKFSLLWAGKTCPKVYDL